jgi:hypothetical protein
MYLEGCPRVKAARRGSIIGIRTPTGSISHLNRRGKFNMNPLDSITGTIISGLVLTAVLVFIIHAIAGS